MNIMKYLSMWLIPILIAAGIFGCTQVIDLPRLESSLNEAIELGNLPPASPTPDMNLLTNSDFSNGLTDWEMSSTVPYWPDMSQDIFLPGNDDLIVDLPLYGSPGWELNLYQPGIGEANKIYKCTFEAYSDLAREIGYSFNTNVEPVYSPLIPLTTTSQSFSFYSLIHDPTDIDPRFNLDFGSYGSPDDNTTIYMKNLRVEEMSDDIVLTINKDGAHFNPDNSTYLSLDNFTIDNYSELDKKHLLITFRAANVEYYRTTPMTLPSVFINGTQASKSLEDVIPASMKPGYQHVDYASSYNFVYNNRPIMYQCDITDLLYTGENTLEIGYVYADSNPIDFFYSRVYLVTEKPVLGKNRVYNGDFSRGMKGWNFSGALPEYGSQYVNMDYSATVDGGEMVLEINRQMDNVTDGFSWTIGYQSDDMEGMVLGKRYLFSIDITSSHDLEQFLVIVESFRDHGDGVGTYYPHTNYYGSLVTGKQTIEKVFTLENVQPTRGPYIKISAGAITPIPAILRIDNVSVREVIE